ncbi:unnamed protein product [Bathycoccus prasinos]
MKSRTRRTRPETTSTRGLCRGGRRSSFSSSFCIFFVFFFSFTMMQTTTKTTEARRSFFSKTPAEETKKSNAQNHEHSFGGDVETHHRDDDASYDDDEHNSWENNEDFDEDYHDYDRYHDFNVTKRLEEIFPVIDLDQNGIVSREELRIWHYAQARNHSENRAEHEFDVTDNDHDGFVTLKEYLEDDFDVDVTGNGTEKEMEEYNVRWIRNARKVFELTDTDKDGKLNRTEFFYFIHPEEGKRGSEIGKHLVAETIRDHDTNMDEKLNFTEFYESLFHQVDEVEEEPVGSDDKTNSNEEGSNNNDAYDESVMRVRALALFARLDKDKDGLVTSHELHADEASYKKLHPTNDDHARDQSGSLVDDADENKDGGLSLVEILKNKMMFYSTAMTSEDDYHDYHDEF